MHAQWTNPTAQIRNIAKAVSTAFAASNLTPEEVNPGRIEIVDLPWAAPPLLTTHELSGIALADLLDIPLKLDESVLLPFWHETLELMWHQPSRLYRGGTLVTCAKYMPRVPKSLRALRFSHVAPENDLAGVTLSLELAHAARISLPLKDVHLDASNYIVTLANGLQLGVRDGRPLVDSPWRADASGQVIDLMEMTRGEVNYTCMYDQISAIRSVLHVHRKSFPYNFEALDVALQALRILSMGVHCPPLAKEMAIAPLDMKVMRERERLLSEAIDAMQADMPDRSKLETIWALLVPGVLSVTAFRRHLFSSPVFPYSLAQANIEKIIHGLEELYRALPAELQRSGVCRT